jgi:FkbM family methyltransferase
MALINILKYLWQHPANRGNRIAAIWRFVRWQMTKRLRKLPIDIGVAPGVSLRCYPASTSASAMIYCNGLPDYHEMLFLKRYLRKGDTFVDVGANIGVYTVMAETVIGPEGRVIAFEPGCEAADRFRENIILNQFANVTFYQAALGAHAGRETFLTGRDTTNRLSAGGAQRGDRASVEVDVLVLDDILAGVAADLGKMDIEGAEPLAMLGAERALSRANPPAWLLEMNGSLHEFGYTEEDFTALLENAGYHLARYDADRNLIEVGGQPWRHSENVLAIAHAALQDVAHRVGALVVSIEPGVVPR